MGKRKGIVTWEVGPDGKPPFVKWFQGPCEATCPTYGRVTEFDATGNGRTVRIAIFHDLGKAKVCIWLRELRLDPFVNHATLHDREVNYNSFSDFFDKPTTSLGTPAAYFLTTDLEAFAELVNSNPQLRN